MEIDFVEAGENAINTIVTMSFLCHTTIAICDANDPYALWVRGAYG